MGDQIKLVEDRMKNIEKFNFSMVDQMLSIRKSLNENIVSLSGKLKARGLVVEEEKKDNEEDSMEEGSIIEITQSHLDQSYYNDKEHLEEELQRIKDVAETIQDLERRMEEHVYNI